MSRIFNDTDEVDVSRKTRATQKVRSPKYSPKYPSETKYEKEVRIAEAENWKRRKGKVIRKCRDQKYTDHTDIRGEEEEVSFHAEEFNNKLSSLVSIGFTIRRATTLNVKRIKVTMFPDRIEKVVWTEKKIEDIPLLRGTIYRGNKTRGISRDEIIILHERAFNGKLEWHRRMYEIPFYVMQSTFFDMIADGPGHYYTTTTGLHDDR